MEYAIQDANDQWTVEFSGRMTFLDHACMRYLINNFNRGRIKSCIFDLKNLEFIDSAALGMLLLARDTALANQVRITLKGACQEIKRLLEVARSDKLFEMQD